MQARRKRASKRDRQRQRDRDSDRIEYRKIEFRGEHTHAYIGLCIVGKTLSRSGARLIQRQTILLIWRTERRREKGEEERKGGGGSYDEHGARQRRGESRRGGILGASKNSHSEPE